MYKDSAALDGALHERTFQLNSNADDPIVGIQNCAPEITTHLGERLQELRAIKWFAVVSVSFYKGDFKSGVIETRTTAFFHTETARLAAGDDLTAIGDDIAFQTLRKIDEFESQGSGWQFESIDDIKISTSVYDPLKEGGSYIPTPRFLQNKTAVVNVQNNDNKCIVWSILAHFFPKEGNMTKQRLYNRHEDELNMTGISFPTPLKQISKIERQNNMSIHVFSYEAKMVVPLRLAKVAGERHVNLLLLKEGDKQHYCLIRNFSRLMSHTTKNSRARFFCFNCLHGFTRQDLLDNHRPVCIQQL